MRAALDEWGVDYREIDVTRDAQAEAQLRAWVGTVRVPALALVPMDGTPDGTPDGAPGSAQPRALLVEPGTGALKAWLARHGLLPDDID